MDCTASMEMWIQASKDQIQSILRNVPHADFQVAFVGYRDHGDNVPLIMIPFTDIDSVLDQIRDVHAEGGDDIAEDVYSGMVFAQELNWSNADVKTIIHIADAPPHGKGFHSPWVSDRYPDTDHNELLKIVHDFSVAGVDYTFVRIVDATDGMIEMFDNSYVGPGKFQVIDLVPQNRPQTRGPPELPHRRHRPTDSLTPTITRSLNASITRYTASQAAEDL
jgi:hypothetical protein